MTNLLVDLRFAFRTLLKNKTSTIVAVLTLALGIGATTAIFSVVYGVLFRPLPFTEPGRLVLMQRYYPRVQKSSDMVSAAVLDHSRRASSFSDAAAFAPQSFTIDTSEGHQPLFALRISTNLLPLLGVRPLLGRTFVPEDEIPESHRVVILSNHFWRARFASAPDVIGRTLDLGGFPSEIVGVLPELPALPPLPRSPDVWVPLIPDRSERTVRAMQFLTVLARLRPGITLQTAQSEFDSAREEINREETGLDPAAFLRVDALAERPVRKVRRPLLLMFGGVALVLLIACTNVSSLLLARGSARRAELAVRASLGASRRRLISLLLSESLLISLAGGALGFLAVSSLLKGIVLAAPPEIPRLTEIRADFAVFAFAVAAAFLSSLLSGLLPALRASRADLAASLRSGASALASHRAGLRSLLVVSQIALAMVLFVGASLLLTSFLRLITTHPGYEIANVLTVSSYRSTPVASATRSLILNQSIERVRSIPAVEAAAFVDTLPLSGSRGSAGFRLSALIESLPPERAAEEIQFDLCTVSDGYFQTLRIPVRSGREFSPSDSADPRQFVVISESLARLLWPGQDPVGKTLLLVPGSKEPGFVLGVVGDIRTVGLDQQPPPTLYRFASRFPLAGATFVVRTSADPSSLAPTIGDALRSVDSTAIVRPPRTMEQLLNTSVATPRFYSSLFLSFGVCAVILAAVGLYGLLAWLVQQRTQEIGVRCALGATPRTILRLILRDGLRLVLAGLTLGLLVSFFFTRLLTSLLYGTRPADPLVLTAAALVLFLVALLACYLPARRATRTDPLTALRYE